ncbi:putative choline transporter, neither null mutation nor overexpression affects choline transport [Linnemannia gamsii]|uniref:Protein PNS1 n=1 Tax=Linnemannia gamsii TaxID=64522 RepID=A0ABQ7KCE2_9FUNG|nr:putative choline transporter, neither null mutation nor overexpression affects choline transport [Linnemannia gamsii]
MDPPNYGHDNGAPSSYNHPPTYTQQEEHAPLIPKTNTDGKFTPDASYKDVWATALFVGNIFGYFGLTYYSAKHFVNNPFTVLDDGTSVASNAFLADHSFIILALTSLAFTFSLAYGYFFLIQRYTAALVKISWFFSVFFTIAIGVLQILGGSLWGALSIAVGVLCLFLYKYWASRMAFAVLVLETVTSVTRKYPATLAVAFSGLVLQIIWCAVWIFGLVLNYQYFQTVSNCRPVENKMVCDNNSLYIAMVYLNFVMFWNTEVIKNVIHVTISGVFGVYYFFEGSAAGAPESPTLASAKRALTTSFGSICFGSLLIALLQTLRYILNSLRSDSDDGIMAFLAMCASCILSMLESLFEIFNKFAFTQVAMYGKPFVRAAKDTWELIKDRGIEALVNDSLVSNVLGMGSFAVALLSGFFGYVYVSIVQPSFYENQDKDVVMFAVVIVEMILGVAMMSIPNNVIDSGVTTTFVALAEDPQTLLDTKPELYHAIADKYPEVSLNVRGQAVYHH